MTSVKSFFAATLVELQTRASPTQSVAGSKVEVWVFKVTQHPFSRVYVGLNGLIQRMFDRP